MKTKSSRIISFFLSCIKVKTVCKLVLCCVIILFSEILLPKISFCQHHINTNSNLYLNTSVYPAPAEYLNFSRRYFVKDTIIEGLEFKKYEWKTFRDSYETPRSIFEYSYIGKDKYILLDAEFETIHHIQLKEESFPGIIFREKGTIMHKKIESAEFPFTTRKTNNKYYLNSNRYLYVSFDPSLNYMVASGDGVKTMYKFEDRFAQAVCNSLDKESKAVPLPSFNSVGDEMQYTGWNGNVDSQDGIKFDNDFDEGGEKDNTNIENKRSQVETIVNLKYIGDSLISNENFHVIKTDLVKVQSGSKKELMTLISIEGNKIKSESMKELNQTVKNGGANLRIKSLGGADSYVSFASHENIILGGKNFVVFSNWISIIFSASVKFVSVFPYPIWGGLSNDSKVTYLKINGEEYGEKKTVNDFK